MIFHAHHKLNALSQPTFALTIKVAENQKNQVDSL